MAPVQSDPGLGSSYVEERAWDLFIVHFPAPLPAIVFRTWMGNGSATREMPNGGLSRREVHGRKHVAIENLDTSNLVAIRFLSRVVNRAGVRATPTPKPSIRNKLD